MDEYQEMGERMKARFSSIENGETADPSAPPTEMDEDVPTAPTLPSSDEGAQPSAPPIETFQSAECVVCMERKVKSLENSSVLIFYFSSVISSSSPVDISVPAASVTEILPSALCAGQLLHRGSRSRGL